MVWLPLQKPLKTTAFEIWWTGVVFQFFISAAQELWLGVEKIKDNENFRREYAAMNLHDRDIIRAARKEAINEKAIESAQKFLEMNVLTPEQIAQGTGLPLKKVLELQNQRWIFHSPIDIFFRKDYIFLTLHSPIV